MKRLSDSHALFQEVVGVFGAATMPGRTGNCNVVYPWYDTFAGLAAMANVPEKWMALYTEHMTIMDRAVVVIEPLEKLCRGGGGILPEETDRQILEFFDASQNRLYQMIQEAAAIKGE